MDRLSRRSLGYHDRAKDNTVLHYSRDEMAEPLRRLSKLLLEVRNGNSKPGETRSGRWTKEVEEGKGMSNFW